MAHLAYAPNELDTAESRKSRQEKTPDDLTFETAVELIRRHLSIYTLTIHPDRVELIAPDGTIMEKTLHGTLIRLVNILYGYYKTEKDAPQKTTEQKDSLVCGDCGSDDLTSTEDRFYGVWILRCNNCDWTEIM